MELCLGSVIVQKLLWDNLCRLEQNVDSLLEICWYEKTEDEVIYWLSVFHYNFYKYFSFYCYFWILSDQIPVSVGSFLRENDSFQQCRGLKIECFSFECITFFILVEWDFSSICLCCHGDVEIELWFHKLIYFVAYYVFD